MFAPNGEWRAAGDQDAQPRAVGEQFGNEGCRRDHLLKIIEKKQQMFIADIFFEQGRWNLCQIRVSND